MAKGFPVVGQPGVDSRLFIPDSNMVGKRLLWEDDFDNGHSGWVQLIDGTRPRGPIFLDQTITHSGSKNSLKLITGSYPDAGYNHGQCMAIRRASRGRTLGKFHAEWHWAYGARYSVTVSGAVVTYAPRALQWGIDQADPDGNRGYFKLRWNQYDQTAAARVTQYQIQVGDGSFYNLPDGVINHGYNENKRNIQVNELVCDPRPNALSNTLNVTTANGSNQIVVNSVTGDLLIVGMRISGPGIPANSWVTAPPAGVAIGAEGAPGTYTMNNNATAAGTVTLAGQSICYDGIRVNGKGFGSLADVPDTSLRRFCPQPSTLAAFAGGFNQTMEVLNRTDSWFASEAWANLTYTIGRELA